MFQLVESTCAHPFQAAIGVQHINLFPYNKGRAAAASQLNADGGDDAIAAVKVQTELLVLRPFWQQYDQLVFFAIVMVVNIVAAEAAPLVVPGTENALALVLACITLFTAGRALVKVEVGGRRCNLDPHGLKALPGFSKVQTINEERNLLFHA